MNIYDISEENLKIQLIEAILEYFEGNKTLPSVLDLGLTAYNKRFSTDSKLAEVASQFKAMGDEIAGGKSFSGESIKETFTTMLEKLTGD
jgi:hypothetical protein